MIVSTIEHPEQHKLWDGIRRLLRLASDRVPGVVDWEPEHVVWVVIEDRQIIAALSTRITEDGEAEVFNVGGQRSAEWLPAVDEHISMWARLCGADKVSARGRKGWGRVLAPLGWAVVGQAGESVLYEKVL